MLIVILELLAPILVTYIGYRIINHLRRGRVVGSGAWQIRKDPASNVFKDKVRMNGRELECIFDTGASLTSIGYDEARRIGIDVDNLMFIVDTDTAVGAVKNESAETEIDLVEIGPIRVRNMGALVSRSRASGCLIGMNFFTSLDSFEIKKDRLILRHGGGPDGVDIDLGGQSAASAHRAEMPERSEPTNAADESRRAADGTPAGANIEPQNEPLMRVQAICPHCDFKMNLPSGRSGRVKCVACDLTFHADTTQPTERPARTRTLDDG